MRLLGARRLEGRAVEMGQEQRQYVVKCIEYVAEDIRLLAELIMSAAPGGHARHSRLHAGPDGGSARQV
jgi:hypothetical protein